VKDLVGCERVLILSDVPAFVWND